MIEILKGIGFRKHKKGVTQQNLADKCELSHEYVRQLKLNKYYRFCTIQSIKYITDTLDIYIKLLSNNDNKKENG